MEETQALLETARVFYGQWEMDFLQMIQNMHVDWLTVIMKIFTTMGNAGICWIVLSLVLAVIPKTRKCGLTMIMAMAITFILGNLVFKNLAARARPCWVDYDTFAAIKNGIRQQHDFSFPSGHTMNGITASLVIFFHYRREGIIAFAVAVIIAFSRMYFFVHWPTDILAGVLLGAVDAVISFFVVNKIYEAVKKAKARKELAE